MALDQAYGLRAEAFRWEEIPETFSVRAELPSREEHAPALLVYARPLLMQMAHQVSYRETEEIHFRMLPRIHGTASDSRTCLTRTAKRAQQPQARTLHGGCPHRNRPSLEGVTH